MMRKFILCIFYSLSLNSVFAQEFMQSVGLVISDAAYPKREYQTYRIRSTQFHFSYNPSLIFKEFKRSSLSVGLPISVGLSALSNRNRERSAGAPVGISLHLPLVLDYNVGLRSTNDNSEKVGTYVGVGFDFFTFLFPQDQNGINSYGPMVRTGIQFNRITLGLFYKKGFELEKKSTMGLSFIARR